MLHPSKITRPAKATKEQLTWYCRVCAKPVYPFCSYDFGRFIRRNKCNHCEAPHDDYEDISSWDANYRAYQERSRRALIQLALDNVESKNPALKVFGFDQYEDRKSRVEINGIIGGDTALVREAVLNFITKLNGRSHSTLFLAGSVGTGKTHIAYAALKKIALKYSFMPGYLKWAEMLESMKLQFGKKSDAANRFNELAGRDILLIDDVDKSTSTWGVKLFFQVMDTRYTKQLPTIVTSNLSFLNLQIKFQECLNSEDAQESAAAFSRFGIPVSLYIQGPDGRKLN